MTSADREMFTQRWANVIAGTSYVSMGLTELVTHLVPLEVVARWLEDVVALTGRSVRCSARLDQQSTSMRLLES